MIAEIILAVLVILLILTYIFRKRIINYLIFKATERIAANAMSNFNNIFEEEKKE
jgi:hypothetical protein